MDEYSEGDPTCHNNLGSISINNTQEETPSENLLQSPLKQKRKLADLSEDSSQHANSDYAMRVEHEKDQIRRMSFVMRVRNSGVSVVCQEFRLRNDSCYLLGIIRSVSVPVTTDHRTANTFTFGPDGTDDQ